MLADVALGQNHLHRLHKGHFLARRLGLVQCAAQRERLAHGECDIGKSLLAILLPQHMVGRTCQALVRRRQKIAVVIAVQHATQDIQLFCQHGIGFRRIHRRFSAPLAGGVFLERALQLVGNADVVHHQAALFILEHAIHPSNGLHQVMSLHRLVHVQGMHARRIKTGQPHIAHKHDAQRVVRFLEALLQPFFYLPAVNVRTQQRFVAGRAGHHNLDCAFFRVWVMPVRAQLHDFVVEMHANLAAHRHYHCLAGLRLVALLEVCDQIRSHAGNTRFSPDHLFQGSPFALELGLLAFFLILGELIHFIVNVGQFLGFQRQLGQTRLEVNSHGRTIFLGLLHVIHMDVIAKHGAGIAVFAGYRRAGERHKSCIGQRIAQMLGIADLIG